MKALTLIQECIRTQNPYLDLGRCGLTDKHVADGTPIDRALRKCSHIKTLILKTTWWDWENRERKLSKNRNEKNFFTTYPPFIPFLKRLENLRFGGDENKKWEIDDISFVSELKDLVLLDISFNEIKELKGVEELIKLQTFYISNNQITEIKGLENLANLQRFHIAYNQITELKGLEHLTNLQTLNIFNNQITELKGLEHLTNLQTLNISDNHITELKGLENLANLQLFDISSNNISELKGLENLANLHAFYIFNNEITELKGLEHLANLQAINIATNHISDIRPFIPFLQREKNPLQVVWKAHPSNGEIVVVDNPLTHPPQEIVYQGNDAILAWFEASRDTFKEIKVLLIGDAKAGKTSLLRQLKEGTYKPDEEQTDGIIIEKFTFKDLATFKEYYILRDAVAYFWDFGGQETMSATHQFFMTRRSVYLVLLEARKDKKADEQLRELMEQVVAFGGNSQVIVVVNKMDLHRGFSLDKQVLQQDYPQIREILYVSCQYNEGIEAVKEALAETIPLAELYDTEIDVRWINIKRELQERTNVGHYLSEGSFRQICEKHGLDKTHEQLSAILFLHDLGIFLHFEELDLSEYFVLEPYWVTTGVYQILTSPKAGKEKGAVKVEDLKFIVNEEEGKKGAYRVDKKILYSANEVRFIADIMTQFKLAYYTVDRKMLLIPDLFENDTPLELTNIFSLAGDALRFVYDYGYLPKSILPHFMVEMQVDIDRAWRSGAILKRGNSQALVMVREKQILIVVMGEHKQKREYLSVIRFFLDKINEKLGLKPTMKIPLPGFDKHFAKYEHLLKLERRGTDEYEDLDIDKVFSVAKLLEGVERRESIEKQGTTIINNYTVHLTGDKNILAQGIHDSKLGVNEGSDGNE